MIQNLLIWLLGKELALTIAVVGGCIGCVSLMFRSVEGRWPWEK